ncbi:MAG: hypothetical protein FP814_10710 [Desulfobacterium sp.]|nr:hypothetical protein [Desulfobacteraceae bacterium]MBA3036948.1 hypothetical protein [Desulfobacterium sp.]
MFDKEMKTSFTLIYLLFFHTATALAGITIHYEGHALSHQAVTEIISASSEYAKHQGWKVKDASAENGTLERVINEKNADYEGEITGVVLYPHAKCEPVYLQFGEDLFMQDFVKTQFAGTDVHILLIKLFDAIKGKFRNLEIVDESEYWDKRDRDTLERHVRKVNEIIADMKSKDPKAKGPATLPSGRIVDIMQ